MTSPVIPTKVGIQNEQAHIFTGLTEDAVSPAYREQTLDKFGMLRHISCMVSTKELDMITTNTELLTANDLLQLYSQGVRGELIRGVLCKTMPTGYEHGKIVMNLGVLLGAFVKLRKLGSLTASDSGVRLEWNPDTVREPDIVYFSADKIPPGTRVAGYAEVVPDLVVEVVSPNDNRREVNDKDLMWLGYGVRLVLVVHPDTRTVDVHQEGHPVLTLTENDTLNGLDPLPGFTCAVSNIFDA